MENVKSYKKTDRIRKVAQHDKLDIVCSGLQKNLERVLGVNVFVSVERSELQRYNRAVFKILINDVVIDGKTLEEVLMIADSIEKVTNLGREQVEDQAA